MSRKDYEELSDIQLPPEQAEMLDIICDAWEECQASACAACPDRPHQNMRIMACTALKYTRLLYEADYRKQSELAREIFAEMENIINRYCKDHKYTIGDVICDFTEVRKKYTEN